MKKVKNAVLLLIAVIGMSASVEAQTTLHLKNGSNCSMDFKVKYATSPCSGSATPINVTLAANTGQDITIPAGNSVRNVKVDDGTASTTVSYNCVGWPQSTVGAINCSGGLTVDYTVVTTVSVY